MTTIEPSGENVFSPKIENQSLVRRFIAQNGVGYVALAITSGDSFINADDGSMNLKVYFNDPTTDPPGIPPGTKIIDVSTGFTSVDTGHYTYDIGPTHTAYRGTLTIVWTYQVGGTEYTFTDYAQILNQMPLYESLRPEEKVIIEQVTWMLGDIFDSTEGGPNLIEPFQTSFDYERLAQVMSRAVTRMNLIGFPIETWGIGPNSQQVHARLQPLLVIGTYLEVIRHLVASYTEIPAFQGANITYTDRRDYAQRWNQIWTQEWPEYVTYVKMAKRKLLNLGRGALLVGGGYYGGSGFNGVFQAGGYAAHTRAFRFYPAAPALSWGSSAHGSGFPSAL